MFQSGLPAGYSGPILGFYFCFGGHTRQYLGLNSESVLRDPSRNLLWSPELSASQLCANPILSPLPNKRLRLVQKHSSALLNWTLRKLMVKLGVEWGNCLPVLPTPQVSGPASELCILGPSFCSTHLPPLVREHSFLENVGGSLTLSTKTPKLVYPKGNSG